jgi:hypothetical protein
MLAKYGGYQGNKIPGADQNQYRLLAVDREICKGKKEEKTSQTNKKSPGPPSWGLCEGPATRPWKTFAT